MSSQCDGSLPEELLVKIIAARNHYGARVLQLKDRVRCLAVCKAWRTYLDPGRWPIQECSLENTKVAEWIFRVQPTVLNMSVRHGYHDTPTLENPRFRAYYNALLSLHPRAALRHLQLRGGSGCVGNFLPVLRPFTGLTYLYLEGGYQGQGECNLERQHLSSLPLLAKLQVFHWSKVILEGSIILHNLQDLQVYDAEGLLLDTALPRLHTLNVQRVEDVRVEGERLRLPALTQLTLQSDSSEQAEVDLQRLTALQELRLEDKALFWLGGLAPLRRLTWLQLDCNCSEEQVAAEQLLHSALQSLCRLDLKLLQWDDDLLDSPLEPGLAAALGTVTQLTSLALEATSPVPAQLGTLSRLQVLRLSRDLEDLTCVELARLQQLRQLQRLELPANGVEKDTVLKLFKLVAPTICIVVED